MQASGVVQQHLDRAQAGVVQAREGDGQALAHRLQRRARDGRCRCLLDHLLVTSLHRAVALEQRTHLSMLIADHLEFDVARRLQPPLEVHRVVTEGAPGQRAGALDGRGQSLRAIHAAHADAAASSARLDQQWVAHLLGERAQVVLIARDRSARGKHRHPGRRHRAARVELVTHQFHQRRGGADEADPGLLHAACKLRVLGQEAIARMHGIATGLRAHPHQRVLIQVALARRTRPDAVALACVAHIRQLRIGLRVDDHVRDAQPIERARNAHRGHPAIGDQHLVEHQRLPCPLVATPTSSTGTLTG